jgi:hypothetical protein
MIKDIDGNDVPLEPSPDIIQDPLNLTRYRHKYTSADHNYYILVTFMKGLDGVSRAKWSKCRYDDDDDDNNNEEIVQEDVNIIIKGF